MMCKKYVFFFLFTGMVCSSAMAQQDMLQRQVLDSALQQGKVKRERMDSLLQRGAQRKDSLRNKLINPGDSVRTSFTSKADSIEHATLGKLDSSVNKLNHALDSLGRFTTLPNEAYKKKVDSLYHNFQEKVLRKYTQPGDSISQQVKDKAQALETKVRSKTHVLDSLVTANGGNTNFSLANTFESKLPEANLPPLPSTNLTLPTANMGQLGGVNAKQLEVPGIETPKLDVTMPKEVGQVTEKFGEATALVGDAGAYAEDVQNIKENGLEASTKVPELAEQQVLKVDEAQGMQDELGKAGAMKKQVDGMTAPIQDEEALKKEALMKMKQQAVDHFAGHEEALEKGLKEMTKYKEKYETVGSITDLSKRPQNPLKMKSLVERFIPGIYLQYMQANHHMVDVNPYVGYHLLPWLIAGGGWNERIVFTERNTQSWEQARIYGPRVFTDVSLGKGFIAHVETEMMNAFVPYSIFNSPDDGEREWVWGMQTGLKKVFGIYKNLKGTVLIQYNLFDPKHKSPYSDRLNSRLGFEWIIQKKKKE